MVFGLGLVLLNRSTVSAVVPAPIIGDVECGDQNGRGPKPNILEPSKSMIGLKPVFELAPVFTLALAVPQLIQL